VKLRIFTTFISIIIHIIIFYILITIPPIEKEKKIKVQPIMVYIPKSPLLGTPPLYIPKEEEKKSEEKEKKKDEDKGTLEKNDIPIIVKGEEKKEDSKEGRNIEKREGKGEGEEGGRFMGKESIDNPEIKSENPQKSERGYLYSDGIGKHRFNYPSGFYFKGGGGGGIGGEGIQGFAGSAYFDSGGYDITPWAKEVIEKVKRNWLVPIAAKYGIKGITGIYLVFEKNGNVSSMNLFRKSGVISFDQSATNAIISSIPFPKLPYDFPKENLPAYFFFYYNIPIESQ